MKTEKFICDIEGCANDPQHKGKSIQVIFTTDQDEGRSVAPYLSLEKIDICQQCLDKVLLGNYIYGNGAQGYNQYYFK